MFWACKQPSHCYLHLIITFLHKLSTKVLITIGGPLSLGIIRRHACICDQLLHVAQCHTTKPKQQHYSLYPGIRHHCVLPSGSSLRHLLTRLCHNHPTQNTALQSCGDSCSHGPSGVDAAGPTTSSSTSTS